jgi:formate transporter
LHKHLDNRMPESSASNPNGLILDAAAITEFAMRTGFKKTHMTFAKTSLLAVLAGIYVAFGCQTMVAALVEVTLSGPAKLLGGAFFATALMIIVLCGAELFTGNVLIFIAVLSKRVYMWEYIFDLLVVYFSNMAGAVMFGILFWGSGINGFEGAYTHSGEIACTLAVAKAKLPEYQALLRGIGANMCVCFSILMAYASKTVSGKVLACIFPVAAFVAMGFEHSIANMYLFTAATLLRCPNFKQTDMWGELFLCTAGNLIGAMFLAASYWYVNIHGTKLELVEVPHKIATCCECGSTNTKVVEDPVKAKAHQQQHEQEEGYFTHSCAHNESFAVVGTTTDAVEREQQRDQLSNRKNVSSYGEPFADASHEHAN